MESSVFHHYHYTIMFKDSLETTFPYCLPREIDFVKKEEEMKKVLDEKDKWYKEQLESLQNRVRT